MPVNMDPKKRRRPAAEASQDTTNPASPSEGEKGDLGKETEVDREKALADAEWKNLWDATEVIDMDTF